MTVGFPFIRTQFLFDWLNKFRRCTSDKNKQINKQTVNTVSFDELPRTLSFDELPRTLSFDELPPYPVIRWTTPRILSFDELPPYPVIRWTTPVSCHSMNYRYIL
jgi:hypothetical protein